MMSLNLRKVIPIFVGLGLVLAYLKTSEAMVQFSPRAIFGQTDASIPYVWAYLAALLVEGLGLAAYLNMANPNKDQRTVGFSRVLFGLAVFFSGSMNLIDQRITDGLIVSPNSLFAGVMRSVITLIPLIVATAVALMELTDRMTPDRPQRQAPQQVRQTQPQLGPGSPADRVRSMPAFPNGATQFGNEHGRLPNLVPPSEGER